MEIIAIAPTYLLKKPVNPLHLKSNEKVVVEQGKDWPVESFLETTERNNGYELVRLGYGSGDWYIKAKDWNWEGKNQGLDRWTKALTKAETTGASAVTARQDTLPPGINSSYKMAETDLERIKVLLPTINVAAKKMLVPTVLLCAIASRESRAGAALDSNGWGDHGNGFGVMQVDKGSHNPQGTSDPKGLAHFLQAAQIFVSKLTQVEKDHPDWEDEWIVKGAIAAYNFGASNVRTKGGIDRGTTGNDYSSDVISRAHYYLKELDGISIAPEPPKEPIAKGIFISGSVGNGGTNRQEDIDKVTKKLTELGFSPEQGLTRTITLFQSIINNHTVLRGDGRVDVNGKTHQWLNAQNAPRWQKMTAQGVGFFNVEVKLEPWDIHKWGGSWTQEFINTVAANYERNYRKGLNNITKMLINDVSLRYGGKTPDHSTHQTGNCFDIRLPSRGGADTTVVGTWRNRDYDRSATIAILNELNKHPQFKLAYFNDPEATKRGLCRPLGGHDTHIHVEVFAPKLIPVA